MTLPLKASKALATTLPASHPRHRLKVRLLLLPPSPPPRFSFHGCSASAPDEPATVPESLYRDLILTAVARAPRAFANKKWVSDKFRDLVVDPGLLARVLGSIRARPRIALRLFRWVQVQDGFVWSERSFCVVLEILAENGLMRSAYWVVDKAVSLDMDDILDVLIGGECGSRSWGSFLIFCCGCTPRSR
ncbi:hypothetical protein NL676_039380 [Syzygium grande]|nr:hypothetical protein NL676_039380 [Syzygium grande]